jgi:hypothetical protein
MLMKTILTTLSMLFVGLTLILSSVSCEDLEEPPVQYDTVIVYIPDTANKGTITGDCKKDNTGDFCFTTTENLTSFVYIFDGTNIKWGDKIMSLSDHQTQCFYALKSGVYDYEVYRFPQTGRDPGICLAIGQVNVIECKKDTLVIQ